MPRVCLPLKNVHGGTTSELPIMARIAVTDGMAPAAVAVLEKVVTSSPRLHRKIGFIIRRTRWF